MSETELLERVPVPAVDHEIDEETGQVILLQPRFRWRWVRRLFAPTPAQRYVRIHLDDLGTWVWRHLDGARSVGGLAESIREAFPHEADAPRRLVLFVQQLAGNRLVRWISGSEQTAGDGAGTPPDGPTGA